ncbi:MAG: DNA/RNA non-specific endonuclease [Sphingobium sp.]
MTALTKARRPAQARILGLRLLSAAITGLMAMVPAAPATASQAELHTFHCLHGCPIGAPGIHDIVVREIYTLASNDLTKMADWVAYRVTPSSIGPSGGRKWVADPWLDLEETLEPKHYDGASQALGIDRGHQVPLAGQSGTPFAVDTNVLSNITPQGSALNQSAWRRLEAQENDLAQAGNIAVYVLTGPLFERVLPPLPRADERHRVPSAYWKVILTQDSRMATFIMDTDAPRTLDHCEARVTLDDVELRSRLALFPRLTVRSFRDLSPELGCAS